MNNTAALESEIITWAEQRGILGPDGSGTPEAQASKTIEEARELQDAIVNGDPHDFESIKQEAGDVLVTIILQGYFCGFDIEGALDAAYSKIKHRTGRMENGVFVKDEDDGHHD